MKGKISRTEILSSRSSGVLMHITSLPGRFGLGDVGPEARSFCDFLKRAGQRYWQVLPLNPTSAATGHSPYSSVSAFAGNPLLISLDDLATDGLIDKRQLTKHRLPESEQADFENGSTIRKTFLESAFQRFSSRVNAGESRAFQNFCRSEKEWLDDFALFMVIKQLQQDRPWFEWPEELRDRNRSALRRVNLEEEEAIRKVKWFQFIFQKQWQRLSAYCTDRGIKLFGDLPFYVSHDSADVWAEREIFSVDAKGRMKAVAGVPPDYFNENGQLWGMPVFRWDVLKRKGYTWWVRRIARNVELYDLLRLDHFRAFAAYWEVPSTEKTARKGRWRKGPGDSLFSVFDREFGNVPFVAEDLGDIDEDVHTLRLDYGMPGMKVLQFAFGGNFPMSEYLPHAYEENFVAYTGTHDNNTTLGWFRRDATAEEKRNLENYAGKRITATNVHTELMRMALSSIATTAILPMQDVLGLNERSRMNAPATVDGNWLWRMRREAITPGVVQALACLTTLFGRSAE